SRKSGKRARVSADWELLDAWCRSMRARSFSPNTLRCYRQSLTRWLFWCADHHLTAASATHVDVVRWLDGQKLGPRSRYARISELATFYRWCLRERLVDDDPTLRVDRPRLGRYLPRPADRAQVRRAVRTAEPTVAAMIALGAFAGMRVSEITNLRVEDLLP